MPFPIEEDTIDYFTMNSLDDFASFMDSVSVPTHPFSPTYQPLPWFYQAHDPGSETIAGVDSHANAIWAGEVLRPPALKSSNLPTTVNDINRSLSRIGSRLSSPQPKDRIADSSPPDQKSPHIHISTDCRLRIVNELEEFSSYIDKDFVLPSRHVLSRFFGSYFISFHDHFPFAHIPTLQPDHISVELFIAIAAIGARYTRELEMHLALFHAAKALVLERIRRHRAARSATPRDDRYRMLHTPSSVTRQCPSSQDACTGEESWQRTIQMVETVLLMIAITTWSGPDCASDSLSMRSMLDCLIREEEVLRLRAPQPNDWKSWIRYEKLKRILFVAFCFFNIHTIAFDIPPIMLTSEVNLDMPCCEKEWKARNEEDWKAAQETVSQPCRNFREAYESLFSNISDTDERLRTNRTSFSSLGGCALIHALIQQIWFARNARLPVPRSGDCLSAEQIGLLENALKTWAKYWEQNQESSLDPLSPHGPIAFTSTALMRLAYIRLNMNLGPMRCLSSWDPNRIARSLHESPPVQRSERLTRAALHCAQALSIPVKLGLNYIAETQVRYWSNQHALCSLECALLLSKWLESVTVKDLAPALVQSEERLLDFVVQLVAETEYGATYEETLKKGLLNARTVRLWARLYQSKSVWEVVDLIGASLNVYADLLEHEHP